MENLFYSRSVAYKFDLKGSVRNRMVNPNAADNDGEIVLLDENLLNSKYLCVLGGGGRGGDKKWQIQLYLNIKGRVRGRCEGG
jgi:hypothetical protein